MQTHWLDTWRRLTARLGRATLCRPTLKGGTGGESMCARSDGSSEVADAHVRARHRLQTRIAATGRGVQPALQRRAHTVHCTRQGRVPPRARGQAPALRQLGACLHRCHGGPVQRLRRVQGATAVRVDSLLAERASLSSAHSMIDEYTSAAEGVAASLRSQRDTFKSAHRKVMDVAAALGVSTSLMRVIERRTTADKILVYGGMAVMTLIVLIVWWTLYAKQ